MRFIAALDTSFFGYPAAQGADIDVTAWSRRQILQHLDLGMIAPSQISAGAINDAIEFVGDGVLVTEDVNGKVIVTVVTAPQLLDWLLDVDTTTTPPEGGQVLAYDGDSQTWTPVDAGVVSGATTLEALTDVNLTVPPVSDGAALIWQELDGRWHAGAAGALGIDDLTDVDVTTEPPIEGQALMWDNTAANWVPGSAGGVPGDPGPVCWSAPVPWSSSTTYITGPPASVVTYLGSAYVAVLTGANHQPDTSPTYWRLLVAKGAKGDTGDVGPASTIPGPANSLAIGTTTTGAAGSSAAATITGQPAGPDPEPDHPQGRHRQPRVHRRTRPDPAERHELGRPTAGRRRRHRPDVQRLRRQRAHHPGPTDGGDRRRRGDHGGRQAQRHHHVHRRPQAEDHHRPADRDGHPGRGPVLWTAGSYITCRLHPVGSSAAPGRTLCMQLGVTA